MRMLSACGVLWAVFLFHCQEPVLGADYSVIPDQLSAAPGETVGFAVRVQTEANDNVVGYGYFSFAIDLSLFGNAGATGDDISYVRLNQLTFDLPGFESIGHANGSQYVGIAGATSDLIPPTFGDHVGDSVELFRFDLSVPMTAQTGSEILIQPSEGFLQNLAATPNFDPVLPQHFEPGTILVIPEPTTFMLVLLVGVAGLIRRPADIVSIRRMT